MDRRPGKPATVTVTPNPAIVKVDSAGREPATACFDR